MSIDITKFDYSHANSTPSPTLHHQNLVREWEQIDELRKGTWRDRLLSLSEEDFGGSEDEDELSAILVSDDGRIMLNIEMHGNVLIPLEALVPDDAERGEIEFSLSHLADQLGAIEQEPPIRGVDIDLSPSLSERETSAAIKLRNEDDVRERKRGAVEGKKWAETIEPCVLNQFIFSIGHQVDVDLVIRDCDCEECCECTVDPWICVDTAHILEAYQSTSTDFRRAFNSAARKVWNVRGRTFLALQMSKGICDGKRWTAEFSTPKMIDAVKAFVRSGCYSPDALLVGLETNYLGAHRLVEAIVDDYPDCDEEEGCFAIDCQEFRDFWSPFFDDLDEFLSSLRAPVIQFGASEYHELTDPHYVEGFIRGALAGA